MENAASRALTNSDVGERPLRKAYSLGCIIVFIEEFVRFPCLLL